MNRSDKQTIFIFVFIFFKIQYKELKLNQIILTFKH